MVGSGLVLNTDRPSHTKSLSEPQSIEGTRDYLPDPSSVLSSTEQSWAKKIFKIYRGMKFLESRKYHAGFFSKQLKGLYLYFAIKYKFID